jgi:hypothetical protein
MQLLRKAGGGEEEMGQWFDCLIDLQVGMFD